MRRHLLVLCGAALLAAAGCGGGGGSTGSLNPLSEGRAALNRMASSDQAPSGKALSDALGLFRQALQLEPSSVEAHFGYAVCEVGSVAGELDGVAETYLPDNPGPADPGMPGGTTGTGTGGSGTVTGGYFVPPMPPDAPPPTEPAPPHRILGLLWHLDDTLANPFVLLDVLGPVSGFGFGVWPVYAESPDEVARRQQMLTKLDAVEDHLRIVEADASFETTLPVPGQSGKTVKVGLPEVYFLDAFVNSLRARLALSLAYVREVAATAPPPMPPGPPVVASGPMDPSGRPDYVSPWVDANQNGLLEPSEYLPPDPYLTLRDAALLKAAQDAMLSVVDREGKAIDGVLARATDGGYLVPNTPEVAAELQTIRDKVLPLIQQAATGPVTVEFPVPVPMMGIAQGRPVSSGVCVMPDYPPFEPVKLTVNLAAWFAHAPADLKAFAPTYPLTAEGWPDVSAAKYPDPTFAGLFPDGLPKL